MKLRSIITTAVALILWAIAVFFPINYYIQGQAALTEHQATLAVITNTESGLPFLPPVDTAAIEHWTNATTRNLMVFTLAILMMMALNAAAVSLLVVLSRARSQKRRHTVYQGLKALVAAIILAAIAFPIGSNMLNGSVQTPGVFFPDFIFSPVILVYQLVFIPSVFVVAGLAVWHALAVAQENAKLDAEAELTI